MFFHLKTESPVCHQIMTNLVKRLIVNQKAQIKTAQFGRQEFKKKQVFRCK